MIVTGNGSLVRLLIWQWRSTILFTLTAVIAVAAHRVFKWDFMQLPTLPLAVVGGALGIFVSFRTNSAYDRWWEGRKLWGKLINVSRMFASQILAYLDGPPEQKRAFINRHMAWVHSLRCALRAQDPFADQDVKTFMTDEEQASLPGQSNVTHALLDLQLIALRAAEKEGRLTEFQIQSFDRSLMTMLDVQGGCERIKKTPMPRGYGFIADRLVSAYGILLPFGLAAELGWATIPINVLVCMSFGLISEVGRVLEDPFTMFFNGLPLFAMSKTVENNVLHRLGDTDLTPIPAPDERGILM